MNPFLYFIVRLIEFVQSIGKYKSNVVQRLSVVCHKLYPINFFWSDCFKGPDYSISSFTIFEDVERYVGKIGTTYKRFIVIDLNVGWSTSLYVTAIYAFCNVVAYRISEEMKI